jgi:hypothetical protein|nr:MAG TPA: hypothetical protein [Caudoviricetes sp.]
MKYTNVVFVEPSVITEKEKNIIFPKEMIDSLISLYPKSRKWLFDKVIPDVNSRKRKIIFLMDDTKTIKKGCLIIKDYQDEKKICTIWVNNKFKDEYDDIVRVLINKAITELKVDMPLVTLSGKCKYFEIYDKAFKDYGFLVLDVKDDYYIKGIKEYCYNGVLE